MSLSNNEIQDALPSNEPTSTTVQYNGSPWTRYFARLLDIYLFMLIVFLFLWVTFPQLAQSLSSKNCFAQWMIFLLLWVFVETMMLWIFGTTPGKKLLSIHIKKSDNSKINFTDALRRSIGVWGSGMAIGLPIINLATLCASYHALSRNGIASWDKRNNLTVTQGKFGVIKVSIAILIFLVVGILNGYSYAHPALH